MLALFYLQGMKQRIEKPGVKNRNDIPDNVRERDSIASGVAEVHGALSEEGGLETAAVCPLDKGEPVRTVERNYRPVSILNTFSKIFEKILKEQLSPFLDKTLSIFIAAYRTAYSTQHVLNKLIEEWKSKLDNNFIVGSVLMDLSKAFDCIPHDLIIAKLHAYGLDENALVLVYSYLKNGSRVSE